MSRRHHGRSRHGRPRVDGARAATDTTSSTRSASPATGANPKEAGIDGASTSQASNGGVPVEGALTSNGQPEPSEQGSADGRPIVGHPAASPIDGRAPHPGSAGQGSNNGQRPQNGGGPGAGCTAPQLRRFIKSRP
jgi:hypothetical protein